MNDTERLQAIAAVYDNIDGDLDNVLEVLRFNNYDLDGDLVTRLQHISLRLGRVQELLEPVVRNIQQQLLGEQTPSHDVDSLPPRLTE